MDNAGLVATSTQESPLSDRLSEILHYMWT